MGAGGGGSGPIPSVYVGGTIYCVVSTPEDLGECVTTIAANLKFTVKDCDPNIGEPDSEEG